MTHDEIYEERVARDKRNYPVMTHNHDFIKDLDGQVTCSICGAMDDDMKPNIFESQIDFE